MVRNLFLFGSLTTILLLAGCGPVTFEEYPGAGTESVAATVAETPSGTQLANPDPGGYELSTEMELLVGTFRLDGTDLAVGADQAGALFPLWSRMKTTLASLTFTVEDVQVITGQIQAALTPDQLQAIDDMNLTFQDLTALMEEKNVSFGRFGNAYAPDDDDDISPEATPGEKQEITPPKDTAASDQDATPQFPGGGDMERWSHMIPRELMDAFLAYLQGKQ
jgi:hypothetical protein